MVTSSEDGVSSFYIFDTFLYFVVLGVGTLVANRNHPQAPSKFGTPEAATSNETIITESQ